MRDHTKLHAFQMADELSLSIYMHTGEGSNFPKSETYGLVSQMRRAAVSVASNIVEGAARTSDVEFARFLEIGYASCCELSYQLSLALRLKYIDSRSIYEQSVSCSRVLAALLKSVRLGARSAASQ